MLRRFAYTLTLTLALGAALPNATQANPIDRLLVGTFNGRPTAPELCDPFDPTCGFLTVTFEPLDEQLKKLKLKGLSVRYFDQGGSNLLFEDFLSDELTVDSPAATFLNPIPLTAAFANIVASRLALVPPARGSFLTLPLLFEFQNSTGMIEFEPEDGPAPTPEPMLLVLLGLGALAAGRRARRR